MLAWNPNATGVRAKTIVSFFSDAAPNQQQRLLCTNQVLEHAKSAAGRADEGVVMWS